MIIEDVICMTYVQGGRDLNLGQGPTTMVGGARTNERHRIKLERSM